MNETLQRINELLKKFNSTFELQPTEIVQDGEENMTSGLEIHNMKNNGSEFINEMFNMFDAIIKSVSDEHELVYNEEKGLVIAKKVVTVDYIIEE